MTASTEGTHAGFGSTAHLAGRFLASLWPLPPDRAGDAWARHWLSGPEADLWTRQSNADRRHALGVARQVARDIGEADVGDAARPVLAAALLHDVGKTDACLGTWGRTAATIAAMALGRHRVAGWAGRSAGWRLGALRSGAWRARAGRYVSHDRLGAELLEAAGSDRFVSTWAREHHLPPSRWTLPPALTSALHAADGD